MKKKLYCMLIFLTMTSGSAIAHDGGHHGHHGGINWGEAAALGLGIGLLGAINAPLNYNYNNYGYGYVPPLFLYIEPPIYIQQPIQQYWYFCNSKNAYFPYVKECPEGWMQVVPK